MRAEAVIGPARRIRCVTPGARCQICGEIFVEWSGLFSGRPEACGHVTEFDIPPEMLTAARWEGEICPDVAKMAPISGIGSVPRIDAFLGLVLLFCAIKQTRYYEWLLPHSAKVGRSFSHDPSGSIFAGCEVACSGKE